MRRYAGDDVQQVLVVGGLEAPRRRPRRRDARPRDAASEVAAVEVTRATVIEAAPLDDADAWLARAVGADLERVTGGALALLNRAVAGHRLASADPWIPDADPARAIGFRVGYGSGEQVAEGDWESARELPRPVSSSLLVPQERLAALLSGRDAALACEELTLRARGDLDHGRPREAALQLSVALEAALAELEGWRAELGGRLDELAGLRPGVEAVFRTALEGGVEPAAVEPALGRLEAALRARRVAADEPRH